jgi:hypothetical protein
VVTVTYVEKGMNTNADVLEVGDKLTREQINAIAEVEDTFSENRGLVDEDQVENLLHVFVCAKMKSCVCMAQRKLSDAS